MAGMFSNRFDVQTALDDRLFNEARSVGDLSSYGVGQMAAYQDGMMGSPFEAALLDKFSPEMQKQNILDELQRKHPNPDTPEKLIALANDLASAGFGDMAQTVRTEATNLTSANAQVLKGQQPSADLYKNLKNTFSAQLVTKPFINDYLISIGQTELAKPFKKGVNGENITQYNAERKSYVDDIEALVENWAGSYQYNGSTKKELATLRGSDEQMLKEFAAHIGVNGNREVAKSVLGLLFQGNVDNVAKEITEVTVTNTNGESKTVNLTEPAVRNQNDRINKITNLETLQNQLRIQQGLLLKNPNAELTQIIIQLLQAREQILLQNADPTEQSASANVTVENTWIT
tara:strand:+ start:121 stop:1158 length:1038 start_codon:yes stop_codon:yes gene_type:complete